ncbi:hypothetical protein C0132_22220 [Priestia aryabhattai]|uniref:hypothetical protein n=1 Tax=Priestia aryabhattai TaxID=412384 RepID=UPI0037484B78
MSEIQIKGSELSALANEFANAESQATASARSLVWHISSLTVGITQASTAQIEAIKDELEYSIKQYSNGLDELQAYVRYTKAKMEEADRKIMAQLSILGGEMLGMSDVQRIFAEHDPVTSERISIGNRVLETGMVMLALVPTLKGGAVAARTGMVFHSLKMSDEAKLLVQSTRNVLHSKVIKNFGVHTYESVKNGAIAWTSAASKGYEKIIKSPIPQLVPNLLSIGPSLPQKTMEQAFKEANLSIVKSIKSNKGIKEGYTGVKVTNNTLAGAQLSKTKDVKAIDKTNSSHITIKNGKINNSGNVKTVKSIDVFDEIEGKINGKYHLYENGQIIFEHPQKNGKIIYKEVNKVPNDRVGSVKELDSLLSGTKLEALEYIDPRSWGRKAVLGFAKKFSIKAAKKEVGKVTKKNYKNLKYDAETKQWKYENGKPIRPNASKVKKVDTEKPLNKEKVNEDNTKPKSKWWHEGYVENMSSYDILNGAKKSPKGLSTLGSATRENAINAGKGWVGPGAREIIVDGKVIGYGTKDRAFRIQFKPKENMWRANFQDNSFVTTVGGKKTVQIKNVHVDITD